MKLTDYFAIAMLIIICNLVLVLRIKYACLPPVSYDKCISIVFKQ